jgi:hypothetical protein
LWGRATSGTCGCGMEQRKRKAAPPRAVSVAEAYKSHQLSRAVRQLRSRLNSVGNLHADVIEDLIALRRREAIERLRYIVRGLIFGDLRFFPE